MSHRGCGPSASLLVFFSGYQGHGGAPGAPAAAAGGQLRAGSPKLAGAAGLAARSGLSLLVARWSRATAVGVLLPGTAVSPGVRAAGELLVVLPHRP